MDKSTTLLYVIFHQILCIIIFIKYDVKCILSCHKICYNTGTFRCTCRYNIVHGPIVNQDITPTS